MSRYHRSSFSSSKSPALPVIQPLEPRQLFSAVDLGVAEVRSPGLPAALRLDAPARGTAVVVLQNTGDARYKGPVTVDLQLTPDGQWNDANPALKTVTKNRIVLRADGKRVIRIKLPSMRGDIPQGTYRVAARITVAGEDPAALANNTGAAWKTTFTGTPGVARPDPTPTPDPAPTPGPTPDPTRTPTFTDLALVDFNVIEDSLEAGTEGNFTVTVKNVGTAFISQGFSVHLWAYDPGRDGEILVGGAGNVTELAPGESKVLTGTIRVPYYWVGDTEFQAEVYDTHALDLADVNRDNDYAGESVNIWASDVDVTGTWSFADEPSRSLITVQPGSVVRLRVDVTNLGTGTLTHPLSVWAPVRIVDLSQHGEAWATPASVNLTLAGGETRSVVVELTVPLTAAGDYSVRGHLALHYYEGPGGRDNNEVQTGLVIRVQ